MPDAAHETRPGLTAVGLAAGYHGHPVVRDLNLEVRPGEIVALLGSNGSGKTTTLRALAGHLPALAGEVRVDAVPTTAPAHIRARRWMSYVTEERSVFSQLTAAQNLVVGRCATQAATALFPELAPLLKRQGGQLSGGEQQMLTLARALARRPRFLLADELSLGLAPIVVTRLLQGLRAAANEHSVGILIVEQHVKQALRYADRVYVLRRGEVVLRGTVAEVEPNLRETYL